jgi:LysR family transcriptional regulator for bpeEF and oprC
MDRVQAMRVFVRIAETNGLGRAAETLGMPASSVTTILKTLEAELGVQLIQRTTRRQSLTADGEVYLDHARRVLDDIAAVGAGFAGAKSSPAGRLKVDVVMSIGRQLLIPHLADFQRRFPSIVLTLNLSDRTADVVEEGLACAIRTGVVPDSATLVARPLGQFHWVTCASPDYLERAGAPGDLEDLAGHACIGYAGHRTGRPLDWVFLKDGEIHRHTPSGTLFLSDAEAYVACALEDLGIIHAGDFLLNQHVAAGSLVPLLTDYTSPAIPVSMVYARHRQLSPVVRTFHAWVSELFGASPLFQ